MDMFCKHQWTSYHENQKKTFKSPKGKPSHGKLHTYGSGGVAADLAEAFGFAFGACFLQCPAAFL